MITLSFQTLVILILITFIIGLIVGTALVQPKIIR